MYPVLFRIPGVDLPIYAFGAMIAVAFFLASLYLERLARKLGDDPKNDPPKYAALSLWVLLGVVGGGRLLYVLVHPDEFTRASDGSLENGLTVIGRILAIWNGGLVFYGGFIAACVLGLWRARAMKLRPWHAADLTMIAGFVGLGIGRIGCLLVGDDHGRICDPSLPFPIALRVPDPLPEKSFFDPELAGKTVYATQIWMMVNAFGIAALGRWLLPRRSFPGHVTFVLAAVYAVTRGVIEYYRGDDAARGFSDVQLFGHTVRLYTSVKIGAAMLPIAIAALIYLRARHRREGAAGPAAVGG